uniref:LAM_G_DOMAIN domain-containing protein n=1 Tax=Globodera pallida TaxID=36090 RepID=A0A183CAV6_GLOPA
MSSILNSFNGGVELVLLLLLALLKNIVTSDVVVLLLLLELLENIVAIGVVVLLLLLALLENLATIDVVVLLLLLEFVVDAEGAGEEDSSEIVLAFGRLESSALSSSAHSGGFVGCLADILFGTKMLSLDTSSSNEFTLSGCTMGPPGAILPSKKATDYGTNKEVEQLKKDDNVVDQSDEKKAEMKTTQKPTVPSSQVRPEGACALPVIPHGEREDSSGMRFGLTPNARVEFALPGTLHASPVADLQLELQLRATAANGVIAFATDERHQDFTALYLVDGKPAFAFGNQQAKMSIQSARSVLDDEWHTLRVEREAGAAVLYVDDRLEVQNRSSLGTIELLQLQSPLYVGGLPPELVPLAARLLPGVKSEFGGCLREFALNDVALEQPVAETDIAQCSQFMEQGVFFGKEGGYAILSPQFVVGMSFSFELELKPRTKTAVLLSVGVLEFLSLQLLNGTVKFAVDNGAGMESVIYDPTSSSNALCDGHWHQIKIIKKKNLITLNVDGKSNLHIMKKKSTGETSTKDPLYMGGVPKDTKLRGLDTAEPYVGCMRILGIGKKQRRRRTLSSVAKPMEELTAEELTERMNLFGSVTRNACPLN